MSDLKRTPLHAAHLAAGAKIVPFAGYEMPVQYTSLMDEHRAVREAAGLFDVSHMGEFHVRGPGGAALLDHLTPSRVSALPLGRVAYSALTTERGTFVDDVLVYRLEEDHFLVVVNAANREKDWQWVQSHASRFDVALEDASEATALVAVQGPKARRTVAGLVEDVDAMAVKYYRVVSGTLAGRRVTMSRTGYTGELGWEIFSSNDDAPAIWAALLDAGRDAGLVPAGLGARDSLRLEAALPLYGNDIDEEHTVLEAGVEFIVDWEKEEFLGKPALDAQRAAGATRRRTGIEIDGRGIARPGHNVFDDAREIGAVTSGSWSPTLSKAIAMAYLPTEFAEPGRAVEIDVRGRRLSARTTALPFYRRPKSSKKSS